MLASGFATGATAGITKVTGLAPFLLYFLPSFLSSFALLPASSLRWHDTTTPFRHLILCHVPSLGLPSWRWALGTFLSFPFLSFHFALR
jgi:uncharacterized membrane protein YhaH (DUF805 family)